MKFYLKLLFHPLLYHLNSVLKIIKLKQKYRTLKIQGIFRAVNCRLGQYNVIAANATLINCNLGDFTIAAKDSLLLNVTMGKFSAAGPGCSIGLPEHPVRKFVSIHNVFYEKRPPCKFTFSDGDYFESYKAVNIGCDVLIGANAIVKQGVTIGHGAIVGAGAVVSKDVAPYSIVVGNPARHIKYRFSPEEIDQLLKLEWWDKDFLWLKENAEFMRDISNLDKMK